MTEPVVVLVPIYKTTLSALEEFSLDVSLQALPERDVMFIAPEGLDCAYYAHRYCGTQFVFFEATYFASIHGYNRLLLSVAFYEAFVRYEFMLILQTDALVLRDELDYWCSQPFDYVGAPWPDGVAVFVNLGRFEGNKGRQVTAFVGNGGLSLRRIGKHIGLLQEFPEAVGYFRQSGSNEDLFFSLMGSLSRDFVVPNEITASRFALELKPDYYFAVNGKQPPMGGHAWWKYDVAFWREQLLVSSLSRELPVELGAPASAGDGVAKP
jgi:hypothetical protein